MRLVQATRGHATDPTSLVHVVDQINPAAHSNHDRNSPQKNDWDINLHGNQFEVQTWMVFMPDSASALVL